MRNEYSHDACEIWIEHKATAIKNSLQSILCSPCQLVEVKNVATAGYIWQLGLKLMRIPRCIK